MRKATPDAGLPPLLELGASSRPSTGFRDFYQSARAHALQTFEPGAHPEVLNIPESPTEFLRQLGATRETQRLLVHEVLTQLASLGKKTKVHGKELYDHQRAHAFHLATQLGSGAEAPNSALVRGAPGTGKTLELGLWMQAGVRAQLRGVLPGTIAYFTQKPFHLVQQTQGYGLARKRLVRTPPYTLNEREVDGLRKDFCKMHEDLGGLISVADWRELFAKVPPAEAAARSQIQSLLLKRGLLEQARKLKDYEAKEQVLIQLLRGQGTLAQGINRLPTYLHLPPMEAEESVHTSFGGDAAFALPAGYPVLAKERWGMSNADVQDPRVLLMPAVAITSATQRAKLQALLKHVQLILLDEAASWQPEVFQNPVREAGGETPLVIAATATDQQKQWRTRTPEHSVSESVERQVLPDVGIDVFPGAQDLHYPCDSMQALAQLIEHHFESLPLLKRLELPEPHLSTSLVVVAAKVARQCAQELQKQYDTRKIAAKVMCLDGKTPQEDREKLLLWLGSGGDLCKVLVGPPASLATALDLPDTQNVTIGTRVTPTNLMQILGRALHSANSRVLVRQQQFADSNLTTTPFAQLQHRLSLPVEGGFTWVPGQALMSAAAHAADAVLLQKKPKISGREVPAAVSGRAKSDGVIAIGEGTQASDFLNPLVASALDALCANPSPQTAKALEEAYRQCGNAALAGVLASYNSSIYLTANQLRSQPDQRAKVCAKIIQLRDRFKQ